MMKTESKSPQNAAKDLTPQQLRAVELLLTGQTVTGVANDIGVSRETVHRWQRTDWDFIAAINSGRRELNEAARARLLSVWARAADNLARAVEAGDLRISLLVLKGLGELGGASPGIGPDDAARLAEDAAMHQRESQQMLELRRTLASF